MFYHILFSSGVVSIPVSLLCEEARQPVPRKEKSQQTVSPSRTSNTLNRRTTSEEQSSVQGTSNTLTVLVS